MLGSVTLQAATVWLVCSHGAPAADDDRVSVVCSWSDHRCRACGLDMADVLNHWCANAEEHVVDLCNAAVLVCPKIKVMYVWKTSCCVRRA